MGMFDTVNILCTYCGNVVPVQTNTGSCIMSYYELDNAPPDVLAGLHNEIVKCNHCKKNIKLTVKTSVSIEVL